MSPTCGPSIETMRKKLPFGTSTHKASRGGTMWLPAGTASARSAFIAPKSGAGSVSTG